MAKKIIKVGFDIDRSSAKEISDILKEVQSSFGKDISKNLQNELDNILTSMERVNSEIKKVGDGDIPKGMFDTLNKEVTTLASSADKLIDKITREIEIDVDTSEFDKKIKESEKKIEQLRILTEEGSHLGTVGGRKDEARKVFGKQVGSKYPGFDGTPESLGVSSIRKDLVHVKSYAKAIENVLILEKELMATKNRTSAQDDKLKSIKEDKEKLKYLQETIELTNRIVYDRTEAHQKNLKEQKEEIKSLKAIQEERRKEIDFGSDSGKDGLGNLKRRAENIIHNQGESKSSAAVKVAETKSKAVELDALKEFDEVDTTSIDMLLGKLFTVDTAFRLVKSAINETLSTISELDAAFVSIAVVTQYSNKEVWGMYDSFKGIAQEAGFTVAEIAGVAGEYFRQGESLSNVLMLTEAAAKAAKVAGIDAAESVRYLTSAVRGYNLAADEAMNISDKFAAVAASSATSYDGLATAMSKVAAQAYANGVEMDNLMGMMATAMDVTQEAPENIGTAFKTILARMAEIKDYGKVLEDGVDANKVETALRTVNVALFDQNKEMRGLDTVLLEVGSKWHTLNKSQKAYLATTLAGTRQQTRLLAVLENYDKTMKNIETSKKSAGATEAQQAKNTESIEHNLKRINIAFESIIKNVANSSAVLSIVKFISRSIELLAELTDTMPGKFLAMTTMIVSGGHLISGVFKSEMFAPVLEVLSKIPSAGKDTVKTFKNMAGEFSAFASIVKSDGLKNAIEALTAGFAKSGSVGVKAIKGISAAAKFLFTSPWGIALMAVVALGTAFYQSSKKVEKLKEKIEELNVENYNLRESIKTVEELKAEYEALASKVIKTTEEMERMREIAVLLKDIDINFATDSGVLNDSIIDSYLKDKKEELNANRLGIVETNKALLSTYDTLSEIEKLGVAEAMAIEYTVNFNLDAWDSLPEEVRNRAVQVYKALMDAGGIYTDAWGEQTMTHAVYGSSKGDPTYVHHNKKADINAEDLIIIENYMDKLVEAEVSVYELMSAITNLTGEQAKYYIEADNRLSSLANLADLENTSVAMVRDLEVIMNKANEFGAQMNNEVRESMIRAFDTSGISGFNDKLFEQLKKTKDGYANIAKMAVAMVDILNELTLDELLNSMTTFDSIEEKIWGINDSLNNLNTNTIRELIDLVKEYPASADAMIASIEATGQVSEEVMNGMMEAQVAKTKSDIRAQIDGNEAKIEMLKAEVKIAETMIKDEAVLSELALSSKLDYNDLEYESTVTTIANMREEYARGFQDIVEMANKTGQEIPRGLENASGNANIYSNRKTVKKDSDAYKARLAAIRSSLSQGISQNTSQIAELENVNKVLELAYSNVGTEAWNAGKKHKEAGKAAKEAAASYEEYAGALTKLYVAQKKLETVDWGIGLIEAKKNAADAAQAVQGIPGAKVGDAGTNTATGSEDLYAAYELRKQQLKELISVNKEYIEMHEGRLNPALKGAYKIINGQVIPVSSKYKNLTGEQMKVLDEFAKSVNELGSSMNDYTKELYAAQEAQNKLIAEMRDAVIEYQELLIDAIKNEEKKYLESFKKIIDGNKKFLEERKKLYEQAFADEDKEESQSDIEKQRLELIEKLAALEAAHDITSIQKKEEYRKQLADLDEQYNNLLIERNREAYLQSIDDQIQYQDELYQNEEEAYNARIESGEWLEQRLKEIQDEARLQAIMDNMLHSMTIQQMLDAGYITQEEITRAGITDMNTTVDELSEEQLGIFTDYWGKNRNVIDQMWNGAEGKVGAKKLSEDAMDNILTYLKTHSTQMEGKTELMKDKVISQWKAMMQKVNEYTKNFNAITLKAPNYSNVTSSLNTMLDKVNTATKGILKDYQKVINKANETAAAIDKTNNKINSSPKETTPPTGSDSTRKGGGFTYGEEYKAFATGGTTERTGLHWLDGTPGKPERVLSPGANKEFENLLSALTIESQQGSTDAEVVETLNVLAQVIQYSSQENASAIINGLASGRGLASIGSIAKELGISTNKKG